MNNLEQFTVETPVGTLYLVCNTQEIKRLHWEMDPNVPKSKSANPLAQSVISQLAKYFEGRLSEFSLPINFEGTEFQKRVWSEVAKIPYGRTVSYKQIALNLYQPTAARAIGTAIAKNPINIVVPCHRVLKADESIGGYAGGCEIKRKLLIIEGKLVS